MITFASGEDIDDLQRQINALEAKYNNILKDAGPPKAVASTSKPARFNPAFRKASPRGATREAVLAAMQPGVPITTKALQRAVHKSSGAVSGAPARLKVEGKVERVGDAIYQLKAA